jgi:hypothetical protein
MHAWQLAAQRAWRKNGGMTREVVQGLLGAREAGAEDPQKNADRVHARAVVRLDV